MRTDDRGSATREPDRRLQPDGTPRPEKAPLSKGLPLGHVAGIPISAHWSVGLTLVLFGDILATTALPAGAPHRSHSAYWIAGIVTAAAFLLLVLAHELAHAVTARHFGVRVKRITLWALGGFTELDGEPQTPRADGLIAFSGPAVSIASGLLCGLAAWALAGTGLVGAALIWLAVVNVFIGVFNLLPGAPLDGGRVLRAVLWARYHDRGRAQRASSQAGRVLGMILLALGFLEVLAGGISGLWLAMIGWFVLTGSAVEAAQLDTDLLADLRVRDVMHRLEGTLPEWWTIPEAVTHLQPAQVEAHPFAVVDFAGALRGTVTLTDLERVPAERRGATRIRDVVAARRHRPLVAAEATPVAQLIRLLPMHGGTAIVVDPDTHPIGIVTTDAIMRAAELVRLGWQHPGVTV